jgi:hypothetical protein
MKLDTSKRNYSVSDRASAGMARFFTDHYERLNGGFKDHELGDTLMSDVYGNNWEGTRHYWLTLMNLWMRK